MLGTLSLSLCFFHSPLRLHILLLHVPFLTPPREFLGVRHKREEEWENTVSHLSVLPPPMSILSRQMSLNYPFRR
jgi:hypothetical protein